MGSILTAVSRRTVFIAAIALVLVSFGLYLPILPSQNGLRGQKKPSRGGVTYIYEMDTHDGWSGIFVKSLWSLC